ncbi:MAG: type IVB secretion system protein IcmW [Gammaproteobacteria bacterium]|nr:type IVB secretion system protein IcmW [Gammaproteobacteria bacterium]
MPDLSREAVHEFWSRYQDPNVYRVITFMEGVETWALDGNPDVENALQLLGQELDNLSKVDLGQLGQQELFIKTACHVKAARVLRILQAIDTAHPGSASKLLIHAEEISQTPDDPPGLFLRRNIVFERLRLLSRVFAPQRIALIMKALEGEEHA